MDFNLSNYGRIIMLWRTYQPQGPEASLTPHTKMEERESAVKKESFISLNIFNHLKSSQKGALGAPMTLNYNFYELTFFYGCQFCLHEHGICGWSFFEVSTAAVLKAARTFSFKAEFSKDCSWVLRFLEGAVQLNHNSQKVIWRLRKATLSPASIL